MRPAVALTGYLQEGWHANIQREEKDWDWGREIPVNEQMMTIVRRELKEKSGVQAAVVPAGLAVSIWHQRSMLLPQTLLQGWAPPEDSQMC